MPIATSQLGDQGYETIYCPGMLASNIAQGAGCCCIVFRYHVRVVYVRQAGGFPGRKRQIIRKDKM